MAICAWQLKLFLKKFQWSLIFDYILKNKLFFFGSYERRTDRSATLTTRTVPTPEFINGQVRYLRSTKAIAAGLPKYGILTDGCGARARACSCR